MGVIQVIAADSAFRRSLKFALEAESFVVDAHDGLASARRSPLGEAALCAVVDEEAIRHQGPARTALGRLGKPVILLVNQVAERHDDIGVAMLVKPMHGDALIHTLREMALRRGEAGGPALPAARPDDDAGLATGSHPLVP
jgi:hypothetical protein